MTLDKRIAEMDEVAAYEDRHVRLYGENTSHNALRFRGAWRSWLREAALRATNPATVKTFLGDMVCGGGYILGVPDDHPDYGKWKCADCEAENKEQCIVEQERRRATNQQIPVPDGISSLRGEAPAPVAGPSPEDVREACAKVCEMQSRVSKSLDGNSFYIALGQAAAAIRAMPLPPARELIDKDSE